MDEFEAIRLADFMSLSQQEAAQSMQISQQTFSRILKRAHKAIADCLVNGKIIRIQGGQYKNAQNGLFLERKYRRFLEGLREA